MADYSIRVTNLKWYQLEKLPNAVCLLGTIAAGKTTIGYLFQKYIDGEVDSNFIQDAKGFTYDNQINPKTLKSLTIYPKLFNIKKNNLNIVQIPSRIYQPQKKRINLDRLLNMSGLCNMADKISLLFMTDARNTGTKIDNWKKVFKSILDNFHNDSITQQVINSIGFIIAKGTSQIDKQTTINRMKNLMKTLQSQERQQYMKLIDHIMVQKKVCIFRKPQKDTDNVNQDIQLMFNFFSQLPMFQTKHCQLIDQQYIELTKQQQKYLQEFNAQLVNILTIFRTILNQVFFNQGYKNFTQTFENNKHLLTKLANDVSIQQEGITNLQCKPLTDRFDQINISECQNLVIYKVSNFYIKLKQLVTSLHDQKKIVSELIQILTQNGIIRKTSQWKSIYLRLIQYQIFQQRFSTAINLNYKKIVNITLESLFQQENQTKIAQAFINTDLPANKEPSFYNGIYEILQKFYPNNQSSVIKNNQKVELLKQSLILMKFDIKNAKQQFPLLWKLTQNKKLYAKDEDSKKFARNVSQIVAKMCYQLKHYKIALVIFYNCGLYHSSLKCYQKLGFNSDKNQYQNQDIIQNYIDLLVEMSLYERAYTFCYSYVEIYQDKRAQIFNKMKEIKTKQLLNFDTNQQNKFLRKQYNSFQQYVPPHVFKQIQQIVQQMVNKLSSTQPIQINKND